MAQPAEFQIARMFDLYGCCSTIKVMRGGREIGRAVLDAAVRGHSEGYSVVWFIGPSGCPGAENFATELAFKPEAQSNEDILAKVELMLRLACSAAEAQQEAA